MLKHLILVFLTISSSSNTHPLLKSKKHIDHRVTSRIKCNAENIKNNNSSVLLLGSRMQHIHHILPSLDKIAEQLKSNFKQHTESLYIYKDSILLNSTIRNLNYPALFWNRKQNEINHIPNSCMKFPSPTQISFVNAQWQEMKTKDGIFRMFNAYLDNRKLAKVPKIRILTMVNRHKPTVSLYCHVWFSDSTSPEITPIDEHHYIWRDAWFHYVSGTYVPYLLSCNVPLTRRNSIPVAVALSDEPCKEARNVLRVIYEKPVRKNNFAICVKGMDFPYWDLSSQLVEWLELTKLLGVSKVVIYEFDVHPNVKNVLKYYSLLKYIEVVPITYSEGKPHSLRVADGFRKKTNNFEQVIAYNDCWNRNMYKYEYISLLDIDEIIIPTKGYTWKELINRIEAFNRKKGLKKRVSYVAREARFSSTMLSTPEIPFYLTMMRRVMRHPYSKVGWASKSIHNTSAVLTLHNHYFIAPLGEDDLIQEMDVSFAQLNHYRYCDISGEKCPILDVNNGTVDTTLWKYIPKLNVGIAHTLEQIECLKQAGY